MAHQVVPQMKRRAITISTMASVTLLPPNIENRGNTVVDKAELICFVSYYTINLWDSLWLFSLNLHHSSEDRESGTPSHGHQQPDRDAEHSTDEDLDRRMAY